MGKEREGEGEKREENFISFNVILSTIKYPCPEILIAVEVTTFSYVEVQFFCDVQVLYCTS